MKIPKTPPGLGDEAAQIRHEGLDTLRQSVESRKKDKDKKDKDFLIGLAAIIVLLVVGIYLFIQRQAIVDGISGLFAKNTSSSIPVETCTALTVDITDGVVTIGPLPGIKIGRCYLISAEYQDNWKKLFTSDVNIDKFSEKILNGDTQTDPDFVKKAIKNSLSTWTLDLRTNAQETAPAPTATEVSKVISLDASEKDIPQNLEKLFSTLKTHNIPSLSGENTAKDAKDRLNWQMFYDLDNGEKDYLVVGFIDDINSLPPNCLNEQAISISLLPTGKAGETAIKAGANQKLWIICGKGES